MLQNKILLLWDRMGDYHRARWDALSEIIGKENCFAADLGAGDKLYKWSNTEENSNYSRLSDKPVDNVGAKEALKAFKKIIKENNIKHVCIPGYGRLAYVLMLLWCRSQNIKVLMFAESWYPGNPVFDRLKGLLIKFTTDVCFVSGKFAAKHFTERLNIPKKSIIEGYSTVDNDHFASSRINKMEPKQLLCVARFAEVKNLKVLIQSFSNSDLSNEWQLRIVGGGPLKSELEELSKGKNIILDDWHSYQELPDMYKQASCFILPSSFEPWGLVVNEAMAAGLPIIVSKQVGAYPDLLNENKNGWSFRFNNQNELINILNNLKLTKTDKLKEMSKQSKIIVADFTSNIWAQKVVNSLFNYNT